MATRHLLNFTRRSRITRFSLPPPCLTLSSRSTTSVTTSPPGGPPPPPPPPRQLGESHSNSKMGFFSFLGRVLFASVFILSAWQMFHEFGEDGGPAAKELAPKVAGLQDFLESKLGAGTPKIDVSHVVALFMALKGLGGLLFVFGSFTGAVLLMFYLMLATPLLHDICNLNFGEPQYFTLLQEFLQSVSLVGALLFFVGMKNSINRRQPKKKTLKPKTA